MKNDRMLVLLCFTVIAMALAFSGCATLTQRIDQALPEGKADSAKATITGKFSATQVEASKFTKDANKVTAEKLHFRHSNAWVPLIEGEVTGYERVRTPAK